MYLEFKDNTVVVKRLSDEDLNEVYQFLLYIKEEGPIVYSNNHFLLDANLESEHDLLNAFSKSLQEKIYVGEHSSFYRVSYNEFVRIVTVDVARFLSILADIKKKLGKEYDEFVHNLYGHRHDDFAKFVNNSIVLVG